MEPKILNGYFCPIVIEMHFSAGFCAAQWVNIFTSGGYIWSRADIDFWIKK